MAHDMDTTPAVTPNEEHPYTMASCPTPLDAFQKLEHILGNSGSIKSAKDVPEFIKVMSLSKFLVSRCIILNIIRATKANSTLEELTRSEGWRILNVWLGEAKKSQNTALLVEMLQVLQRLPVSVSTLKQGNMGKLIRHLSKSENPEVKTLAAEILEKWMAIFKGQPPPGVNSASGKTETPAEERRNSTGEPEDSSKILKSKKSEKKTSSKKKSKAVVVAPPVESAQLPPGPMVALGKPKDKLAKRLRDPSLAKAGQPPVEKKLKGNNGPKESEGFMAFLSNQAATKLKEKKVKKPPKVIKLGRSNSVTSEQEVTTPTHSTPTIDEEEETAEETTEEVEPGKKKKKVTWATDDNLTTMHYFELDESERVNVSLTGGFMAAAQLEKAKEREALESGLMFTRDRLIELVPWVRPPPLDVTWTVFPRGEASEERNTQAERETTVLAQLFLSKASVAPSPMEPDPEPSPTEQQPKIIPLNQPGVPPSQPPPGMYPPPSLSIPPAHITQEPPLMSPGTTINQAQSLINYLSENSKGGPPGEPGPNGQYPLPPGGPFYQPFGMDGMRPPFPGGRGGFRRRGPLIGVDSRICKHFLTHGCRLGSNCKFLHCTPEELAANPPKRGGFRGRGTWRGGTPFNPPTQFSPPVNNSPNSEQTSTQTPPSNNVEPNNS